MPRRLLAVPLAGVTLVLTLVLTPALSPVSRAEAQSAPVPAGRLTACVAVERSSPRCHHRGATYEVGRTVWFRGRVAPTGAGPVQVWRRTPDTSRYERVGRAVRLPGGRLRWRWTPGRGDARPAVPYSFFLEVAGVGRSPSLEVWVVPRHGRPPLARRFTACAAVSPTDPRCFNGGVDVRAGATVHLRGRIHPRPDGRVDVLRGAPGRPLRRVGTALLLDGGRLRWSWRTSAPDRVPARPHLVAFRSPAGGRSNVVSVYVT